LRFSAAQLDSNQNWRIIAKPTPRTQKNRQTAVLWEWFSTQFELNLLGGDEIQI